MARGKQGPSAGPQTRSLCNASRVCDPFYLRVVVCARVEAGQIRWLFLESESSWMCLAQGFSWCVVSPASSLILAICFLDCRGDWASPAQVGTYNPCQTWGRCNHPFKCCHARCVSFGIFVSVSHGTPVSKVGRNLSSWPCDCI